MGQNNLPDEVPESNNTDEIPQKKPDAELRLTDGGIEMPEFLKGYVGTFTMRSPNVTGDLETSDAGMPETEFYDGILAAYPEDGDYNADLSEGMLALSTSDHRETVFQIIDEREDD